jgi:hypothetical protein
MAKYLLTMKKKVHKQAKYLPSATFSDLSQSPLRH